VRYRTILTVLEHLSRVATIPWCEISDILEIVLHTPLTSSKTLFDCLICSSEAAIIIFNMLTKVIHAQRARNQVNVLEADTSLCHGLFSECYKYRMPYVVSSRCSASGALTTPAKSLHFSPDCPTDSLVTRLLLLLNLRSLWTSTCC
jgi:hypothetical protein